MLKLTIAAIILSASLAFISFAAAPKATSGYNAADGASMIADASAGRAGKSKGGCLVIF